VYIVAVLRDRVYCRVERSVLTVINEYVMLCMLCYVSILKYKEITFYTTANSELFHMHLIHILHV